MEVPAELDGYAVTAIGDKVYWGCEWVTSITVPEGVTTIAREAFKGCSSLTSVVIPQGVTTIGKSAFSGCRALTNLTLPESIVAIQGPPFFSCPIEAFTVTVGSYAEQWAKENSLPCTYAD